METLNFTVPANTTGMGNPTETSGDMFVPCKKKKKMKSLKDYIKDKKRES